MLLVVPTVDGVVSLVLFLMATSIASYLLTIGNVVSSDVMYLVVHAYYYYTLPAYTTPTSSCVYLGTCNTYGLDSIRPYSIS